MIPNTREERGQVENGHNHRNIVITKKCESLTR